MFSSFMNPDISPVMFWIFIGLAVILQGISKSGLIGASVLSLPLMIMVMPVDKVASTLLPLLVLCDLNAVYHHHRNVVWRQVWIVYLPAIIGIALGTYLWWKIGQSGVEVYSDSLKRFVGAISLIFGVYIVAKEKTKGWLARHKGGPKTGAITGIIAGFTSTLVHSATPIVSLYLFSQNYGKILFVGTMAWTFTLINTTKIPFYAAIGMLPKEIWLFDLLLVPLVPLGSYIGKWLLHHVSEQTFNNIMMVLAILAGLQLLFNIQLIQWLLEAIF